MTSDDGHPLCRLSSRPRVTLAPCLRLRGVFAACPTSSTAPAAPTASTVQVVQAVQPVNNAVENSARFSSLLEHISALMN